MNLVISDTSPIRALEWLGLLNLLQALYGEILIPPAVADKLRHSRPALSTYLGVLDKSISSAFVDAERRCSSRVEMVVIFVQQSDF